MFASRHRAIRAVQAFHIGAGALVLSAGALGGCQVPADGAASVLVTPQSC